MPRSLDQRSLHQHAVVIGASMAGLAAARVLSDHFESVTVLDRDPLPAGPGPRKGVPQGRHAHALLAGGARAIAELFPGIMEELVADGAALMEFNEGSWYQAGGYRAECLVERKVVAASRPFIEAGVRRRVAALSNVTIRPGHAVETLLHERGRVTGVKVFDGTTSRDVSADLVVDCSGRGSQGSLWMEELGYAAPDTVEVRCDMRYATVVLPRRPGDLDGDFAVIIESPPHGKRAAFLIPIEGDRWIATIGAGYGAEAPVDEAGFRAVAASLPSPELHQVLEGFDDLGHVATHRLVSSKRRRYERLRDVPAGFLALGDAVCSFNPIYGQGMSSGVLQAVALGECLQGHENDEALVRAFYRRAAKVIANPWQIAVGADFAYAETTGPKPLGTDLVNRYMSRVLRAAQVSPEVNTAMILVQNLLAPPSSLLKPSMVRTVRRASRDLARHRVAGRQPAAVSTAAAGA
jgi:2-polyprenyl-6-methoxyphenol hydroxylase-like FAD-dependent oxidoreductase